MLTVALEPSRNTILSGSIYIETTHTSSLNTNNVERQDSPLAGNDDVDVCESLSGYEADGVNLDAHHKFRSSALFLLRAKEVDGISQCGKINW